MAGSRACAVLWDMDGVIVDSAYYHVRSWQETYQRHGITYTERDFKRDFGKRNEEIITTVLGKDFTEDKFKAIARQKEIVFRRLIKGNVKALPGVISLLNGLDSAGFLQALVSSTPLENINLIINSLGIRRFFRQIVSGYDVTEGKPSPQGYLLAARGLGSRPQDCLVIEDAMAGIGAARAAGMKCIAVTTTHPAEKLAAADRVVSSLESVTASTIEDMLGSK